jgi:hypothetical protein
MVPAAEVHVQGYPRCWKPHWVVHPRVIVMFMGIYCVRCVSAFVEERFGPLIAACEEGCEGGTVDVAGNCLWQPCVDAMTRASPDMFACLDANTFHMVEPLGCMWYRYLYAA